MRRRLIPGLACAAVLAIGGCSSATPLTGTESGTPAHTMPLSTLTSGTDTHATGTAEPTTGSSPMTGSGDSGTALPGLSAECTAVIHAQAAVNKLFSAALGTPDATGAGSATTDTTVKSPAETTEESATTDAGTTGNDDEASGSGSASGTDTTSDTDTTSGTGSPSPDGADATPLTEQSVTDTFDRVDKTVPDELDDAFDTLRTTAEGVIGKSAADVSGAITKPDALKALSAISDYIAGCTPTTS